MGCAPQAHLPPTDSLLPQVPDLGVPGVQPPKAAQLRLQGANDAPEDHGVQLARVREGPRVVNPEYQDRGISEAKDPPKALSDPERPRA